MLSRATLHCWGYYWEYGSIGRGGILLGIPYVVGDTIGCETLVSYWVHNTCVSLLTILMLKIHKRLLFVCVFLVS